jgi:hypothetical protein
MRNNFTWQNSSVAGGAPGEAGGTFKRVASANAGWYADITLGGNFHGPAYHWNQDGSGRAGYSFSNGALTSSLPTPPAQP